MFNMSIFLRFLTAVIIVIPKNYVLTLIQSVSGFRLPNERVCLKEIFLASQCRVLTLLENTKGGMKFTEQWNNHTIGSGTKYPIRPLCFKWDTDE